MYDIIKFILRNRRWVKDCRRTNIVTKDKIAHRKSFKIAQAESNVVRQNEALLLKAIQMSCPEWFGDHTEVTVNRNVKCEPHIDKNNDGYSYFMLLGTFTGGAMVMAGGTRCDRMLL
jgi:hypothetical protein